MSNPDEEKTRGWSRCEDKGIISTLRLLYIILQLSFPFSVSCLLLSHAVYGDVSQPHFHLYFASLFCIAFNPHLFHLVTLSMTL